jgi:hypothetical protein
MVATKWSIALQALLYMSLTELAMSSLIAVQNTTSVGLNPPPTPGDSFLPAIPLPFIHSKPITHQFNQPALVLDDFIPTLKQLLSIGSSRNKARARRALSLKLITLILQDDPVNSTESTTPDEWIPSLKDPKPLLPAYWTVDEKSKALPETATKWSSNIYSVIGKPATWTNGLASLEHDASAMSNIVLAVDITEVPNVTATDLEELVLTGLQSIDSSKHLPVVHDTPP